MNVIDRNVLFHVLRVKHETRGSAGHGREEGKRNEVDLFVSVCLKRQNLPLRILGNVHRAFSRQYPVWWNPRGLREPDELVAVWPLFSFFPALERPRCDVEFGGQFCLIKPPLSARSPRGL